jgi:hypothetical protein
MMHEGASEQANSAVATETIYVVACQHTSPTDILLQLPAFGLHCITSAGVRIVSDRCIRSYVVTVAAGKRLIAKAVAQMDCVQTAMQQGMIAVGKGTTNAYILEELFGRPIDKGAYCLGKTTPPDVDTSEVFSGQMEEVVFKNGAPVLGLGVKKAAPMMSAGDIVIKGANALDYAAGCAGLLVGHPAGGTWGALAGPVYGRGLHAIIPIGLEKQVAGSLRDTARKLAAMPELSKPHIPSLWIMEGQIVTELEALKLLTGAECHQIGSGGVCGAEGAARLLVEGTDAQVAAADALITEIQNEPPFGE